ncbi:hypothetical protein XthCFBP4691_17400 [Xanthomonas theicola]|uniref:Serine aminopeptidase S33 domain-containing protein n=1 Tax=Xanthomonas theicola TaxID=56464 RepID=A0A2S6ZB79_9XANT|nr:hypothetical protein XthCFBP4691_17400 [Xanthomonas theicola]
MHPAPVLSAPTLVLHGGADTCNHPDSSKGREAFFSGWYERQAATSPRAATAWWCAKASSYRRRRAPSSN